MFNVDIPRQQLPFKSKTKKWRKQHLDWADDRSLFNFSPVRKSVQNKKINYDLVNGVIHMDDLEYMLNPDHVKSEYIPDKIQHYPIINASLDVLRGEELARVFDYQVVVTNPDAVSEIEKSKRDQVFAALQAQVENQSQDEQSFQANMDKLGDYFQFEWKDQRELRANLLLNHYWREQSFPMIFNNGFMDGLTVGEEVYQCAIEGGEPVLRRLNPMKVRAFQSGYSNRIEDADIIILEDYISPGKVIDTYYDQLTSKDIRYIEELPNSVGKGAVNSMDQLDERHAFLPNFMISDQAGGNGMFYSDIFGTLEGYDNMLPYDLAGNIRVIHMYWRSRRKIKKVKSYDENGKETFNFYTEKYVIDKAAGETEETFWINQAWEGVKIGDSIYVNMGPCPVQYNRMSNPSVCHFGIIGTIYSFNDAKPYSLVDRIKPFSYLYDAIHDRLNKLIARNWGKIIPLDLAKIPQNWAIDKWLYYARSNNLAVYDSANVIQEGPATGKMPASMNNNYSVLDAETGNSIQQHMNLLEYIKQEIGDVTGITKQRVGQIASRETVGGVAQILFNETSQVTANDGLPFELANSGKMQGLRYVSTEIGCQNKWSVATAADAIYFIDGRNKGMYALNASGIKNISQSCGMASWFKQQQQLIDSWKPSDWKGIRSNYDMSTGEVFVTFEENCLCFDTVLQDFTSFYDYRSMSGMFMLGDTVVTIAKDRSKKDVANDSLWLHRKNKKECCNIFGVQYEASVEVVCNSNNQGSDYGMTKIFDNLTWRADAWGNNNDDEWGYRPFVTFSKLSGFDDYQEFEKRFEMTANDGPQSSEPSVPINLRKKFKQWHTTVPRAKDGNGNEGRDRICDTWCHIKLTLEEEVSHYRHVLHDLEISYFIQ